MTRSHIATSAGSRGLRIFGTWILGFAICLASAAGCAKARAETVPDGPPLAIPPPPERVLVPVEAPAPVAAQPEPEPPAPTAAAPKPAPKPAPPAPKPQPAPPVAAQAPPPTDTRQLTTSPASSAATERNVRDLLARAARDLGRVNYTRLSTDGRAQYDQSKRFSEQAQDALRERNFPFAQTLADKAATLAAELLQ
jgi:type IV secretory pathway VirB10-like protein